jgi:RimJ/RimL family protein N-acetyltransferase
MEFLLVKSSESVQLVSDLAAACFPIYYDYVHPDHVAAYLEKYQSPQAIQQQIQNGSEYYLIFNENKNIGYFGLDFDSTIVHLSKIYLLPSTTGQGFGKKAISWIIDLAKRQKITSIQLKVMLENKRAIRFYENCGFVRTGEYREQFESGEVEVNDVMTYQILTSSDIK